VKLHRDSFVQSSHGRNLSHGPLGRELVFELDPRNQRWSPSSGVLSSIDLDRELGIGPHIHEEEGHTPAFISFPAPLDPSCVIEHHVRRNTDFSASANIPFGGVKNTSRPFTPSFLLHTAAVILRMPHVSTLLLPTLDLPSSRDEPMSRISLPPNADGTSTQPVPPFRSAIPREVLDIGHSSPRPGVPDEAPDEDTICKLVYAGFM
jgi:hypothetical protein